MSHNTYIDREKSWLAFNARVLQEAGEVIEKAQKAMPKNKIIAKAATQVEAVEATVGAKNIVFKRISDAR